MSDPIDLIVRADRDGTIPGMQSPASEREPAAESDSLPHSTAARVVDESERRIEWQQSTERKSQNREWLGFFLVFAFLSYAIYWQAAPAWIKQIDVDGIFVSKPSDVYVMLSGLLVGIGFVLLWCGWRRSILYRQLFDDRRVVEAKRSSLQRAEASQGRDGESPSLESLWNLTQRRLDYYHDLATEQAEVSFARAQAAAIAGSFLILVLVWFSIVADSVSGSVVAGSIAGLAGAATAYISATFIRSQEATSSHLRSYFLQPLEFSRFLAAERIAMRIQDQGTQDQTLASVAIAVATGGGNAVNDPAGPAFPDPATASPQ